MITNTRKQSSSLPAAPFDLYEDWHYIVLPFYSCVNLSVAALIVLALDLSPLSVARPFNVTDKVV